MPRQNIAIGVLVQPYGNHPASWLLDAAPKGAEVDIDHYINLARIAEAGCLDFLFFADVPAVRQGNVEAISRWPIYAAQFEPLTLISALPAVTDRIGLISTASTSYYEPYNVARMFASMDHISKGRIGWNVVTTSQAAAAYNFGRNAREEHAVRYVRAREFIEVVTGLWQSWDPDAFLHDREAKRFFDPARLHVLDHSGEFFDVRGPLNVPRPPQDRPVIVQAGGSEAGRALAAETAEVVFTADREIEDARKFYADLKGRLATFGRSRDELKILAGLNPIIGRTRSEAEDRFAALQKAIHPDVGREMLSVDLDGVDLSDLDVESPIPLERLPAATEGGKSYLDYIRRMATAGPVTLRQLYEQYAAARGGNFIIGTPADVADLMEEWVAAEAADGFMIGLSSLPDGMRELTELVLPELRRRGLFRDAYEGRMLRDHLKLPRGSHIN